MIRGTRTANSTPAARRPPRWITRKPALRRALCASAARVTPAAAGCSLTEAGLEDHRLDHREEWQVGVVEDVHRDEDPEDPPGEEDGSETERHVQGEEHDGHARELTRGGDRGAEPVGAKAEASNPDRAGPHRGQRDHDEQEER